MNAQLREGLYSVDPLDLLPDLVKGCCITQTDSENVQNEVPRTTKARAAKLVSILDRKFPHYTKLQKDAFRTALSEHGLHHLEGLVNDSRVEQASLPNQQQEVGANLANEANVILNSLKRLEPFLQGANQAVTDYKTAENSRDFFTRAFGDNGRAKANQCHEKFVWNLNQAKKIRDDCQINLTQALNSLSNHARLYMETDHTGSNKRQAALKVRSGAIPDVSVEQHYSYRDIYQSQFQLGSLEIQQYLDALKQLSS